MFLQFAAVGVAAAAVVMVVVVVVCESDVH